MKNLKLLILEDCPDDAEMQLLHLTRAGYQLDYKRVENRETFIAALEETSWDIIISDFNLPDFTGLDALKILRRKDSDMPFIIVSGVIGEDKAVQAMLAGANDYLMKDNLKRLVPAIERELQEATNRLARRSAEIALRESEERLKLALLAAEMGVWEWNLQTDEVYWSPECYSVLGVSEFGGKKENFESLVHPDDLEPLMKTITEAVAQQKVFVIEFRMTTQQKKQMWVANRGRAEYNSDGTPRRVVGTVQDITARKQAEQTIRESEENFRALVEASSQFVWTADENGKSRDIAEWLAKVVEKRKTALPNFSESDYKESDEFILETNFIHQDDREGLINSWRECVQKKSPFMRVFRLQSPSGYRYLAARSVPVFSPDKKFRQWVGTFSDITERMLAEEALRESEEQNRVILNSMISNIAVLDRDGNIVKVNEAWRKFALENSDGSEEVLIGTSVGINYLDVCQSSTEGEIAARGILDVLSGKTQNFKYEYPCHAPEKERWFLMTVTPLKTANGGVVISHADISERRLAEKEIRFQAALLDMVGQAVIATDFTGKIIYWNKFAESLYGWTAEEAAQRTILELTVAEEDRKLTHKISEFIRRGQTWAGEIKSKRRDGTEFTAAVTDFPIYDEKGNLAGIIGISVDITEQKQAEEALQNSLEQLRQSQKLESIGRLAGGIAHDFNNMLTAIKGYSELALRKLPETDSLRHYIEEIKKAGEHSASLTQQLLAFSRRQILQSTILNVNQVISDTTVMLERLIGEDIELVSLLNSDIGLIEADPGQLSQVLMNLVVNSRDAMPQGGTITIETDKVFLNEDFVKRHVGAKVGSYVLIAVSDTGCGMEKELLPHIFEPFFTTKEIGKGTGLGLSTVYGIINQLGGFIRCHSTPNQGTTFEIFLPSTSETEITEDISLKLDSTLKGNETILLVEDEDLVRKLTRQILETCGYKVMEARNGAEALEIRKKTRRNPDLLITDVVMPQMNGRELAEKLREELPNLPVIFTSGYVDVSNLLSDFNPNDTNFIQKPFTINELSEKVREILDQLM